MHPKEEHLCRLIDQRARDQSVEHALKVRQPEYYTRVEWTVGITHLHSATVKRLWPSQHAS